MCIFTNGYKDDLRVSNTSELYRAALELFNNYNPAKHLYLMQQLGNTSMSEHQFAQIIGKMRLYQCLPTGYQKVLPRSYLQIHRLILWLRHTSMMRTLAVLEASLICGSSITCLQELTSQAILIHS